MEDNKKKKSSAKEISDNKGKKGTTEKTQKKNTATKGAPAKTDKNTAKKKADSKAEDTNKSITENDNNKKKPVDKKKEKLRKTLMYVGFVICAIFLITTVVSTVVITRLDVIPVKYVILIDIIFFILIVWLTIMQRWFVPGIIGKVIAVILTIVMIVGSIYMNFTYKSIKKMTGVTEKVDMMCVYVMYEDEAQTLQDAKDYSFGVLSSIDHDNTVSFKAEVSKEIGSISVIEYDYVLDLVAALYNGEVQAILLNSAYVNFATGADDYKNFESETRVIFSKEIVTHVKVDKPKNENYTGADKEDGEIFTIYISGIDTRGSSPRVNSNSDVNILMTVNTNTRQVFLLSTPRDFYVPLSISNGVKDKLTHAGGHGIDVSVDTLEMLYEINIDDYIKVNFTGFIDVIDALGGVNVYSDYSFYTTHGGDLINVGYNECDGAKALGFARERCNVPGGDRTRGKNQMAVIEALIKKMASSQLLNNYTEILDSLTDSMVTSMSYDEISDLIKFQLEDMRGWDVVKYSVDGYNSEGPTYSAGSQLLYVMEPDQETVEQAKTYLRQIYAGEKLVIKETTEETTE